MEVYAMPILVAPGKVKWIHAKDFDPEIHKCHCPQCQADRLRFEIRSAYRKIVNQILEKPDNESA